VARTDPDLIYETIWRAAAQARIGVGLQTSDPERSKQRLYAWRKRMGGMEEFQIRVPPPALRQDFDLIIIRARAQAPGPDDFGL
jgi:hypothetical protein